MRPNRAALLSQRVGERDLDALIVTNLVNVRYLTGFTGTNGLCLVGPSLRAFFTDFRYSERAAQEVEGFERDDRERELLPGAASRLEEAAARRVGFEDGDLSVRQHRKLRELLPEHVELIAAGDLVETLRAVKDEREIGAIREAAKAVTGIYDFLREVEFDGRTEREVALHLEAEMRARGTEPAFPTIVAAGPNGARPHATPGDEPIRAGSLVVVDLGCTVDGYSADCTRTFAAEGAGDEAHQVYELVREAQEAALGAVRPGAECRTVDSVARDMIVAAGHGERFGHGLGHGVGLEVHEAPTLSQRSEAKLEAGNVVTVEPGVYLPAKLGVRIEDTVLVSDDGAEPLTSFPKSLITLE